MKLLSIALFALYAGNASALTCAEEYILDKGFDSQWNKMFVSMTRCERDQLQTDLLEKQLSEEKKQTKLLEELQD